ncbi:hypothetical protein [Chlorogloea sp. CCALA 695]|uniref:hypothetical protein n=1 Tax=Chlorogloea sp. CCALA 695 TaxID=2107693 RepID=UPI0030DCB16C
MNQIPMDSDLEKVVKSCGGSFPHRALRQDAIGQDFMRLQRGRDTWVLEADIRGFFDNIAHESILNMINNFPKRKLIREWLKAGFVFDGKFNPTETGTLAWRGYFTSTSQHRIAWIRNIHKIHQLKIWSGTLRR